MSVPRIIVRDLGNYGSKDELFRTYSRYGEIRNIWMATSPPGFAYVFFKNAREAMKAVSSTNGSFICGERVRVEYLPTEDKKEFNSRLSNQSPVVRGRTPPPYSHRPMPPPRRTPPPSRPPPRRSPVYRETGPPKYSHYPLSPPPPSRSRHKSPPSSHRRSPPPPLRGYESSSHSDYSMHSYHERGGQGNSYAHRDPYKREDRIAHYDDIRERREDHHHKRGRESSGYVVDRYVNKHSNERRLSPPPLPPPPPPHRSSNYSHGHRDSGRRLGHYSLSPPPLPHNHTREHDLHHREQRRPPPPPIHRDSAPRKSYQREAYHQHVPSSEPRLRSSGPNKRHSDHRRQSMPSRRKPKQVDLWTNPNQPRKRQHSHGGRGRKGGGGRRRRERSRSPHYNNNANDSQPVDPNEFVFYETNDTNDYVPEQSPPSLPPETESQEAPISSMDEERFSKEEYQGNDHSNIQSPQTSSIVNDFAEQDEEIEVDVEEGYQQDPEVFPLESQFLQLEELQGDSPQVEEQEQPVQNQFYGNRKVNYSSKRSEREVICVTDERQVRVSRSPSLQESRSRSGTPTLMD